MANRFSTPRTSKTKTQLSLTSRRAFGRTARFALIAAARTASASRSLWARPPAVGLYKCYECRKPFTVRMKTISKSSHIALHLWLQVIHLMCASKKGISTRQVQRILRISMKSAWFLSHRIREAMRDGSLAPMGGAGKTVEVDETFAGKIEGAPKGRKPAGSAFRSVALTLVERGGPARSFHVENTSLAVIMPIIRANIASETAIMTDKASWYKNLGR